MLVDDLLGAITNTHIPVGSDAATDGSMALRQHRDSVVALAESPTLFPDSDTAESDIYIIYVIE